MARLPRLCVFRHIVRQLSSEVAVYEGQPTKFAVINGKFVRVSKKTPSVQEEVTHTGQFYEDGDWRKMRFSDRTKLVNRNWAVKMVAQAPPVEVEGRRAMCDGREGPDTPAALGHPKVYMNLDKGVPESCMYCGARFVQKQH